MVLRVCMDLVPGRRVRVGGIQSRVARARWRGLPQARKRQGEGWEAEPGAITRHLEKACILLLIETWLGGCYWSS